MGAISFSLDPKLAKFLKHELDISVFIETGTFAGDTIAELEPSFDQLVSIEIDDDLYAKAVSRFADSRKVEILQGDSAQKLLEIQSQITDRSVMYWLDAHWCEGGGEGQSESQCPLLEEIRSIKNLNSRSVLLIDDARLFMAPPGAPQDISQWPSFSVVLKELNALSDSHSLMIMNDVIIFYPLKIESQLRDFAQINIVDMLWLTSEIKVNEKLREAVAAGLSTVDGLNSTIALQKTSLDNLRAEAIKKEEVIKAQANAVRAYQLSYWPLYPLAVVFRFFLRFILFLPSSLLQTIRPKLGILEQYSPRPLAYSSWHRKIQSERYPSISLVTPSYNQGRFIEATIESVISQGYPELEYIIQDGGSQDDTVEVLRKYENKAHWVSEPDGGQSEALNKGFAKTGGEIMAWLNSDDLLLPGSLHSIGKYFRENQEVDVVYGNRILINEKGLDIGRWILPGHDSKVLSWADFVPQETLFWRRRIWEQVGGKLDESFQFAMDWDLLIRFRDADAIFGFIPLPIGAFRIHESQKTSASITDIGHQEMNRIRKRVLGAVPNQNEIYKATMPFLLRHVAADKIFAARHSFGRS